SPLSFAGTAAIVISGERSPRAPGRAVPGFQRRPDAAREAETVDRRRRSQRFEAMQFDAAPLEAALFQNVARRRIGDPRAGNYMVDIEFFEGEVDHGPCGFSAEALAPMVHTQPIAEFRGSRFTPVDFHHADWLVMVLDQE